MSYVTWWVTKGNQGNQGNTGYQGNLGNQGNQDNAENQGNQGNQRGGYNHHLGINPADPLNQLNQAAPYNKNGTNQPLASNIAQCLDLRYQQSGTHLSSNIISPEITKSLVAHLRANDPERYYKLYPLVGRTSNPQWSNLSNSKGLRDNLRNIP